MVFWLISAVITADVQVLVEKLAEFGINWIGSTLSSDIKLQSIMSTLANIQSFITDAEDTQLIFGHAWQTLLDDFEDARYQVEDLLDIFVTEVCKLEDGGSLRKTHLFGRLPEQKVELLQAKLDAMLKKLDMLQSRVPDTIKTMLPTTSLASAGNGGVFGRDTDITNFIEMLERSESSSNVSVIPICGVMGVGKSTLAQVVYNHNKINASGFNIKIWVSVLVKFDVTKITRSILEEVNRQHNSVSVNTESLSSLESLQHHLADKLRGYKFLLVIDNLWNVKREEWDLLLKPLNHGEGGSKIIVTTESRAVSKLVATAEQYELKCVSANACLEVIQYTAFGHCFRFKDPEMEASALEIAFKCDGLPALAKIAASELNRYRDSSTAKFDWTKALDMKVWELAKINVYPFYILGHIRLPWRLRQCFAYCSMFPQCYEFEKHKIIRMWIGGGLIICDQEWDVPEEIGCDYIYQLLENSFFGMEGTKYIIQAAVHRIIQSFYSNKFLRMEETTGICMNGRTKHLSLFCDNLAMAISKVSMSKSLRSLILFVKSPSDRVPPELFQLARLRVLDLSGTQIKDLTGSIGKLIHLRFLDLSSTLLKWLPETMKELRALQTLILTNNPDLLLLPDCTCKLISLLHLQLGGNGRLSSMPLGFGKLIGLQTVDEFIVGSTKGQINELKNLNNIQGSLCIKQLENVEGALGDLDADLASKKNLESLEFQWSSVDDENRSALVLDKLVAPYDNLKQLLFTRYGGTMFPQWVSSPSFSKLETICIYDCENCVLLPALGQLPKLKFLRIVGMDSLKKVEFHGQASGFPLLETLEFEDMPNLEEWVGAHDNEMARLRKLEVVNCLQLIKIPSLHLLQYLEELKFADCPMLPLLAEQTLSSSVKSLVIKNCSMLDNRYSIGSDDRIKIVHIPRIEIDASRP